MKFNIENLREIKALVRELAVGLRKLSIPDNFSGFEVDLEIPATSEVSVTNRLQLIPTRYIILSQTGNGLVTKSSTPWTLNQVFFYNNGAETVSVKIQVMR